MDVHRLSLKKISLLKLWYVSGLKFKSLSVKISNDGRNSFTPNYTKLFPTGSEFKKKGINVVTQNTSLSKKLELLDAYEDEYDGGIIRCRVLANQQKYICNNSSVTLHCHTGRRRLSLTIFSQWYIWLNKYI